MPAQVSPPRLALGGSVSGRVDAEVVALPVIPAEGDGAPLLGPGAADLAERHDLLGVLELAEADGAAGEVTSFPVTSGGGPLRLILMVGVGSQARDDFRRAGAALARATRDRTSLSTSIPAVEPEIALEPFVVGLILGSFGFSWRAEGPPWRPVESVTLTGLGDDHAATVERARTIGAAGWRSRFLATLPANAKSPAWFADQATEVAAESGLKVRIWDEVQLAEEGFGGIVGVGQASATPPRLIRLDYTPAKRGRRTPTVVLVGKGITFDTGGLSLKPAQAMANMKRDMTGGAVVLSTMAALAGVGCPVKVVGLIASAENAVSGRALRPGDVLRHYGGRTSEVTNTDAEGRLVMADALAYAAQQIKPAALVDVATLTGAMKVALGQSLGGFFASDEALAGRIAAAAEVSGERLWRMPLATSYEEKLTSSIADADNAPGGPGAITAALFLRHFTDGLPWAHLDVASVGDAPKDDFEWSEGPTGFGARVLLTWLGQPAPLEGVGR